jgi:uncharacterized membrane protein YfcA
VTLANLVIFAAGIAAGAINSIAGGARSSRFPRCCGSAAIRSSQCDEHRRDLARLARGRARISPRALDGARLAVAADRSVAPRRRVGSWLLLRTPSSVFERLVPFLILAATILLALQEVITKHLPPPTANRQPPTRIVGVFLFQLLVATYGGYFGAGMGILMLAALGLIGLTDLHQMNGLKNVLAVAINGIAAIYFALANAVAWRDVLVLMAGSIVGGYLGARIARRLGRKFVRVAVVAIGLIMTVALFLK